MFVQIRFDPVYVGHFKCNIRTIRNGYPNIHLQVPFCLTVPRVLLLIRDYHLQLAA